MEKFELCNSIINVIEKTNTKYNIEIPTKITTKAISDMKIEFMVRHNLSGDIAYRNREHYADIIMKELFN